MVDLDDSYEIPRGCRDPLTPLNRDVSRVARGVTASDKTSTLARIIEADIIPRLLLANGAEERQAAASVALDVDSEDIDAFADMIVGLELGRAHAVVAGALSRGVSLETILLDIFSPTAQRLGERWEDDRCTFTDVTVGLCGLQSLLRAFETGHAVDGGALQPTGQGALVAALPGEQHTFGVLMVESFLRRYGWEVIGMPLASRADILSATARRSFLLIGLSLSQEAQLDRMATLICGIRRQSLNPSVVIMVGGRVFSDHPEFAKDVGADMTAADGHEAAIASQHVLWSTIQPN
ncbi:MAG: cobalamin-dependent protein [Hansschlegelia sp.]